MPDVAVSPGSWRTDPLDRDGERAPVLNALGATAAHVILVDDDDLFRESLGLNLADHEYDVTEFSDGQSAIDYFRDGGGADVLLLDWRMPGLDGLQVLRMMRSLAIEVPTIFLTVLDNEIYEEAALEGGAVDFVEKARGLSILLRRMALIMQGQKAAAAQEPASEVVQCGPLELRHDCKRASWNSLSIDLTLTEFRIVDLLAEKVGSDVSYREIYDLAHGRGFIAGSGEDGYRVNVRTFIKRIRRKFKEVDSGFEHIENYPGFGYRWRTE